MPSIKCKARFPATCRYHGVDTLLAKHGLENTPPQQAGEKKMVGAAYSYSLEWMKSQQLTNDEYYPWDANFQEMWEDALTASDPYKTYFRKVTDYMNSELIKKYDALDFQFVKEDSDTHWKTYRIGMLTVQAKVFAQSSQFGVDNGRVSKISIYDDGQRRVSGFFEACAVHYDRGWDIKPTSKFMRRILKRAMDKVQE
jgi:hypothetical protein